MDGLAAIGVATLVLGGPLAWTILLNLRDRRQARLLRTVLDQLSSRELRGRIAVEVRCALLSADSQVAVHVLTFSQEELWEIMTRLAQRLAPRVRLEVSGQLDRLFHATVTMRTTGEEPHARPRQPSLATN
ncbi:MAG: hypothetical protein HY726_15370 [Candidatus Rokubacteria bacterium]|nr:hypothetical protein [Candidatus Rokubacteria bacterium]